MNSIKQLVTNCSIYIQWIQVKYINEEICSDLKKLTVDNIAEVINCDYIPFNCRIYKHWIEPDYIKYTICLDVINFSIYIPWIKAN